MLATNHKSSHTPSSTSSESDFTTDSSDEYTDRCDDSVDIEESFANMSLSLSSSTSSCSGIETPSSGQSSSESDDIAGSANEIRSDLREIMAHRKMDVRDGYVSDSASQETTEDEEEDSTEPPTPTLRHTTLRTRDAKADEINKYSSQSDLNGSSLDSVRYGDGRSFMDETESDSSSDDAAQLVGPKLSSASFGSRVQVLNAGAQFLASTKKTTTEYNLVSFLLNNDGALNSQYNLGVLLRAAITCAHGGRKIFETYFPDLDHVVSIFKNATNNNRELNVTMWCLLGHYVIRSFHISGGSADVVYQKYPACAQLIRKTPKMIGGNHIWSKNRRQGHISDVKWFILRRKSKIHYSKEFGLLLMNLVGLNLSLD